MNTVFTYRRGTLCAEELPLTGAAGSVDTPFYCYSTKALEENYRHFFAPLAALSPVLHYAVKACSNLAVIRTLANCGAGADVVSVGEMQRALQAGVPPQKIVFSSVGKTRDEITGALIARIHQLNVESIPELHAINDVAADLGVKAPVALRVNPNVNAGTYEKTSTGHKETKFGIDADDQLDEALRLATTLPHLDFKGFTIHIGSHINDYAPFRAAYGRLADIVAATRAKGIAVERLDLGGGVTIPYDGDAETTPFAAYADIVNTTVSKLGCAVSFEPGRRLVGDAAILVTRVIYVKDTPTKRFVVVDAAMNDLVRPAMYGARHSVIPVRQNTAATKPATLVGPVCETSDLFGEGYTLPADIAAGDLLAIMQAGAYGATMSSFYNSRPLIPELIVRNGEMAVIRRRISATEQIGWEQTPPWL